MQLEILMPKLGLTMTRGRVMEWLKKEGDPVTKGEALFSVENDKAVVEVEATDSGKLGKILVQAGEEQEVGKPVALLEVGSNVPIPSPPSIPTPPPSSKAFVTEVEKATHEAAPSSSPPSISPSASPQPPAQPSAPPSSVVFPEVSTSYPYASPRAKYLAKEHGLDLSQIKGTGPKGAVIERDLQQILSQIATPLYTLSNLQIRGGERMVQSWTTIPQFTLWATIEVDPLLKFHQELKEEGVAVSFTVLLSKLLAKTLKKYPLLNSSFKGNGKVELFDEVNVGIAFDSPDGLMVPVLKNCEKKSLISLQEEWEDLSHRAKARKLRKVDLEGGTFTLSNLGMFDIQRFQAIVNPPQAAILSVGKIERKAKELPESSPNITFVSVIEFGLSADHRVGDGAYAAKFLQALNKIVQKPALSLALGD
ncbi:MAG: dihydrolipoamide acetyltransferase family protein [Spirochaetales bacterium]